MHGERSDKTNLRCHHIMSNLQVGFLIGMVTKQLNTPLPRGNLDKHENECGHDRPSWHYLGLPFTIQKWIWTQICKVDILQNGVGPIWGNVGLIGSGFGPKLSKVGTIDGGFGAKLGKVDTIGRQN